MARALWRGAISFGLVVIPVSLYPAKDTRESLTFHMLHKDDLSRIHNKRVDDQGHEVAFEDIVKGYEYEKGRYVVMGDSDFEAANVEATESIDIIHFVRADDVDIAYYDTPYYTEPSKAGRKAYALLREALKRSGRMGVATIVIRSKQHLCALVADGPALLACTLRWPYQLRDASEFNLPGEDLDGLSVSPQELSMAEQLVETMSAEWNPDEYRDTYHDDLMRLIDRRIETGQLTEVSSPPKREAKGAKVIDIMSLLKQSMAQQEAKRRHPAAAGAAAKSEESRAAARAKRARKAG